MKNRSQLLIAIEKWQAFKGVPVCDLNSPAWKDAHTAYEEALYEAGVYKEALRGQRVLSEEVRRNTEEPERTFYHWAYCYAGHKPETLKALQKAKSYAGRTDILDGIQAAFNKAELKKEEARKADCQSRTAVLIAGARAESAREEQHKARLAAEAAARAMPRQAIAAGQAKGGKSKPAKGKRGK